VGPGTAWYRSVEPTDLPLEIDAVKLNRRVDDNDEDAAYERRIRAATEYAESRIGRGLLTQTWVYQQDYFTREWLLPMAAPLQSVSSVKYYDPDGVQQTLATSVYLVDSSSELGRITLAPGESWPSIQSDRPLAVQTTYVVGWTDSDLIPQMVLEAMLLFIGDRDEHRENTVIGTGYTVQQMPYGTDQMLAPFARQWYPPECW